LAPSTRASASSSSNFFPCAPGQLLCEVRLGVSTSAARALPWGWPQFARGLSVCGGLRRVQDSLESGAQDSPSTSSTRQWPCLLSLLDAVDEARRGRRFSQGTTEKACALLNQRTMKENHHQKKPEKPEANTQSAQEFAGGGPSSRGRPGAEELRRPVPLGSSACAAGRASLPLPLGHLLHVLIF
jgi:hypothetical protein